MNLLKNYHLDSAKDYIMIVVGLAIYAFGFTAFILPEEIVTGGLTGVVSLIYFATKKYFGIGIPIALSNYALNIIMLCFAFKVVGRKFVIRTIFGASVISILIGIMQPLFVEPFVKQQPFMNTIIGAMCCGVGIGMAFVHNGSTGGTDIIAAMVNKRTNVTIGRMMMYTDMVIISSSYLLFHSIDKIVYGFVILFIMSFITDQLINTNRQAIQFMIFSDKWAEIADAINNDAHRGCTMLEGVGWYTKKDVKVLLVMCRKIEQISILKIIKSIDKNAFVSQANVNGVYGAGFDEVKFKIKSTYQPVKTEDTIHKGLHTETKERQSND